MLESTGKLLAKTGQAKQAVPVLRVALAIRDHVFWRRNYHPSDPTHITEATKRSDDYLQAVGALQEGFHELLAFLKQL